MVPNIYDATSEQLLDCFLLSLGLDTMDEHLRGTPERIARFYKQWMAEGKETFRFTTFKATSQDMVMTGHIRYHSLCIHHFVPFFGYAHVAYLPRERMAGLSKLARTVNMFSHRPQVQERLTKEIAEYIHNQLDARGVGVVMTGEHLCMSMRGIRVPGHSTVTDAFTGDMARDKRWQTKLYTHINLINKEKQNER